MFTCFVNQYLFIKMCIDYGYVMMTSQREVGGQDLIFKVTDGLKVLLKE